MPKNISFSVTCGACEARKIKCEKCSWCIGCVNNYEECFLSENAIACKGCLKKGIICKKTDICVNCVALCIQSKRPVICRSPNQKQVCTRCISKNKICKPCHCRKDDHCSACHHTASQCKPYCKTIDEMFKKMNKGVKKSRTGKIVTFSCIRKS